MIKERPIQQILTSQKKYSLMIWLLMKKWSLHILKTIIKQLTKQTIELGEKVTFYFKELRDTGQIKEVHPF